MKFNKVNIIVCYHKDATKVDDDVFLPVHVGKATSSLELNIQGDDEGDNISNLNNLYCELTGLYWAWKNLNADYYGLCHYRRFFTFKRRRIIVLFKRLLGLGFSPLLLSGRRIDRMYYDQIKISSETTLAQNLNSFKIRLIKLLNKEEAPKIIVPAPVHFLFESVRNSVARVAGQHHLDILKEIIVEHFPAYLPYYVKTIKSNRFYYANMAIMEKSIFDEYCTFLFSVLEKHKALIISRGLYSSLSEGSLLRLSGYLGELLTSVFILSKKDKLKSRYFKEVGMILYQE